MMRRRLPALLAVKAVALLAMCAGVPTLAPPYASAAPGGHHPATRDDRAASRRADTVDSSVSVGIHVLPRSGGGGSATAHSQSDNDISADIDSGGEHGTSSHHSGTSSHHSPGRQAHGNTPRLSGPHGERNDLHRSPGHGGHRHGHLPFTGRNTAIIASGGAAALLTGAALLWMSRRRKRAA